MIFHCLYAIPATVRPPGEDDRKALHAAPNIHRLPVDAVAASIAGARRWLPPAPRTPWPGVLDATAPAPACSEAMGNELLEGRDHPPSSIVPPAP